MTRFTRELLPEEKRNTIISIMGRKESGKSTLVKEIIEDGGYKRVFVLDTNGEYGEELGFEITHTLQQGARKILAVRNKEEFRISLRYDDTEDGMRLLKIINEINFTLVVIEETHMYVKPAYIPPELSKLVRLGRHHAISQIYVSQRPSGLNRNLTSQSDFLVTFRQGEPIDIKWLEKSFGKEEAQEIQNLPDYKVAVKVLGNPAKLPIPVMERIPEKKRLHLVRKRA